MLLEMFTSRPVHLGQHEHLNHRTHTYRAEHTFTCHLLTNSEPPLITALQITLPCVTMCLSKHIPECHRNNSTQGSQLNLVCGVRNLAKFGVHAGNMKCNAQNKE